MSPSRPTALRFALISLLSIAGLAAPALAAPDEISQKAQRVLPQRDAPQVEVPEAIRAPAPEAGALSLTTLKMGSGVVKRRLKGEASRFVIDGSRVHAYAVLSNPEGPPKTVQMVWFKDGVRQWAVDLKVGRSARWRTWSYTSLKRAKQIGAWTVRVYDEAGAELGHIDFRVDRPDLDEIGC